MPVKTSLPDTHEEYRMLNFSRDSMTYLSNNLMTAVMLIFFFVIFSRIAQVTRTDFEPVEFLSLQGWEIFWIFVLALAMMYAHEGMHWLSFKLLGKAQPAFLVKGVSPQTLVAKQYFQKGLFILLELMPILLLSVVYLVIAPLLPLSWMEMTIYFFAGNVAYGTTDLVAIVEVLRGPKGALVEYIGEHVYLYADKEYVAKVRARRNQDLREAQDKASKKK